MACISTRLLQPVHFLQMIIPITDLLSTSCCFFSLHKRGCWPAHFNPVCDWGVVLKATQRTQCRGFACCRGYANIAVHVFFPCPRSPLSRDVCFVMDSSECCLWPCALQTESRYLKIGHRWCMLVCLFEEARWFVALICGQSFMNTDACQSESDWHH